MSTTPDQPGSGLDLPGTPAPAVGPLAGVRPPQPLDPESARLLGTAPRHETAHETPYAAPTASSVPAPAGPGVRVPRIRTIVFGLVLLAIAGTVLVGRIADVRVDGGAVALVVLVVAGVLLLGGGLAAAAKEARGGPGA